MGVAQQEKQHTAAGGAPPSGDTDRPPWLLVTLFLVLPLIPLNAVLPGPLLSWGSPAKIIGMIMLGLAVLTFVTGTRRPSAQCINPGAVVIIAYFFIWMIVWGVGLTRLDGDIVEASKDRAILSMLPFFGAALYTMTRVSTERQRNLLLGLLTTGLVFEAVIGIIQHTTSTDYSKLLQPPGFVLNLSDQGRGTGEVLSIRAGAVRAFGTAIHAIEFSVLMAITVPLALHLARYARTRQRRLAASLAAVLALVAVPTAVSRSGIIALTAALLIYMWCLPVKRLVSGAVLGLTTIVVGYLLAPTTANAVWQTITGSADDPSVRSRVVATVRASQVIHDQPIFGLGAGATIPKVFGFLDNQWLQNVAQGGLVGLFAMTLLAAGGAMGIAVALRSASGPSERSQFFAIGSVFGGILATSFTFDLFAFAQVTFVFFLMFGLLWSTQSIPYAGPALPRSAYSAGRVRIRR